MGVFVMPSLGADMEAGTLVEWMVGPGDEVHRGDVVAVVETQKGAIEIEVFNEGILAAQLTAPGEKVPVGHVLATIRGADEPASATIAPHAQPRPPAAPSALSVASPVPPRASRSPRVRATPLARRQAAEWGLELATVTPGSDGIVGAREVAAKKPAKPPRGRTGVDLAEMRKAIAAAMARSASEIPHYYVSSTLEVSRMTTWLAAENATRPPPRRLLYLAAILKATALALRKTPDLNGTFAHGQFEPAEKINIGVGIALRGGGLISPAIRDVDTLGLDDLMSSLSDLVLRVRAGRLRSSELSDSTITLSNLGERTADALMPLIYPPQVAIIGCGQIAARPWVSDGDIVARDVMTVTVAGDHRVGDGRLAAQFLGHLEELLKRPENL